MELRWRTQQQKATQEDSSCHKGLYMLPERLQRMELGSGTECLLFWRTRKKKRKEKTRRIANKGTQKDWGTLKGSQRGVGTCKFYCCLSWQLPMSSLTAFGFSKKSTTIGCMRQVLGPGALGKPRGIGWRGRWEGGLGWGTHVNPWLIHVHVWQKPLQYYKVISLQLIKTNGKKIYHDYYIYTYIYNYFLKGTKKSMNVTTR